jgi:hypothetical protein
VAAWVLRGSCRAERPKVLLRLQVLGTEPNLSLLPITTAVVRDRMHPCRSWALRLLGIRIHGRRAHILLSRRKLLAVVAPRREHIPSLVVRIVRTVSLQAILLMVVVVVLSAAIYNHTFLRMAKVAI